MVYFPTDMEEQIALVIDEGKAMAAPSKEMLLDWYRQMVLIREFEETCHQLYEEKRITGVYLHLYSGHEASGVGSMAALRKDRPCHHRLSRSRHRPHPGHGPQGGHG